MADRHDSLVVSYRKRIIRSGFKEVKSPMPTYRPDIFAQKTTRYGKIREQIAVEAEIESTLFGEHTTRQLLDLSDLIEFQKARGIKVRGYLLVPRGRQAQVQANSLLLSLFPKGNVIKLLQTV